MATAYACEKCGELFRGKPADLVRKDHEASLWLRVTVVQKGEEISSHPDLCPKCHLNAILAVLKDMGAL